MKELFAVLLAVAEELLRGAVVCLIAIVIVLLLWPYVKGVGWK